MLGEKDGEKDGQGVWDGQVPTAIFKWITSTDLLCSTENSAQCYVTVWMGGALGAEWIHVYAWVSHFAIHLKLTTLLIGYIPM